MATQKYIANQRIRRNGTLYEPGETMELTEEEALPLHVVPAKAKDIESSKASEKTKPKVSTAMNAKPAIAMIEDTPYEELEGFFTEDEDRTTVVEAWENKQAEAKQNKAEGESESE